MKKSCAYLKKKHWGRKSSKWKKNKNELNQWFPHVIAKRLAKQRLLLFLLERDLTIILIEFSILTWLWSEKVQPLDHIVSLCELEKRQLCIQVNASLYQGTQLEDWKVEWISDPLFLSPVSLCRTQLA